jgi:hypothetical protein
VTQLTGEPEELPVIAGAKDLCETSLERREFKYVQQTGT